jgi:uncharacterized membrane protein
MTRLQRSLAATFTATGILHFIRPREYEATVPAYIPISPRDAVRWSGVAEVVGGLAVIPAPTRRFARWWLTGLLVAIFPANLHMALHPEDVAGRGVGIDRMPRWLLFARLPVQAVFIGWAWRATE